MCDSPQGGSVDALSATREHRDLVVSLPHRFALFPLVLFLFAGALHAQPQEEKKWGHLTGTFIYAGESPIRPLLPVGVAGVDVRDESLMVGMMRGVENIVVYLHRGRKEELPPVHPSSGEIAEAEVPLKWPKGRPAVTIEPGENDLGTIRLAPAIFED